MSENRPLRQRLLDGDPLAGLFIKTPYHQIVEILAGAGLDFIVFDAEHAPFDRTSLDACLLAARSIGLPALVRVPGHDPSDILTALDLGASGVLVPHVTDVDTAKSIARAARFGPGGRGFSTSPRAGGFRAKGIADYLAEAERETVVLAQIEDPEGVENVDDIARIDGIDALFIGRADLTVGYGKTNLDDPATTEAVEAICAAGKAAGRRVAMFLGRPEDAADWQPKGVTLFVFSSDQTLIQDGSAAIAESFAKVTA